MGCVGKSGIYSDQDLEYFRLLDMERVEQSGVVCEYYSLNRSENVDALYGEPDNDPLYGGSSDRGTAQTHDLSWNFCPDIAEGDSALEIPCVFEYVEVENRNPMVRPEGKVVEHDAVMVISAGHWGCKISESSVNCLSGREPKEGDVVYGFGQWWDVIKVGDAGPVLGTSSTVGYHFELKKRSQFTPDRKVNL